MSFAYVDVVKATYKSLTVTPLGPAKWVSITLNGVPAHKLGIPVRIEGCVHIIPGVTKDCLPYDIMLHQMTGAQHEFHYQIPGGVAGQKFEDPFHVDGAFNGLPQVVEYTFGSLCVKGEDEPGFSLTDAQIEGTAPYPTGVQGALVDYTGNFRFLTGVYIHCKEPGARWRLVANVRWSFVLIMSRNPNDPASTPPAITVLDPAIAVDPVYIAP
jgi:hypothetical protein